MQTVLEEHGPSVNGLQEDPYTELSWLPNILKEFILPTGFPGDNYLPLSPIKKKKKKPFYLFDFCFHSVSQFIFLQELNMDHEISVCLQ